MASTLRRSAALCAAVLALAGCPGTSKDDAIPTASAGLDRAVPKRTLVLLDGSASARPPGWTGTLRYRWTQVAGAPVTLSDATATMPSFTTPAVSGPLTFSLVVTAGGASAPASVTLTVVNQAPLASAGPDLQVRGEWLASLSALGSWDPDGDPLTVTWVQTGGPAVVLDEPVSGLARFTAPVIQGNLTFLAVVSDGEAAAEDEVVVRVLPPGANLPPTADAGPDLTSGRGTVVSLDGAGADPDGFAVAFTWEQIGGPPVALVGSAGQPRLTFVAPAEAAELEFRLTVSDGMDAVSDTVLVHVRNLPPTIAGLAISPPQPRTADDLGVLVAVSDPEGDVVTVAYAWKLGGVDVPGQAGGTFPASLTSRGDVVSVTVTAGDGLATSAATASTTILDTPPSLQVGLPAELPAGVAATARVTAVDPDGDPVPTSGFSLAYGPAGMVVADDGAVTWTPDLPMFDRTLDVRYGVRLGGAAPSQVEATVRVSDPARPQALRRAGLEIARGPAGMKVQDLDGDGRDEVLISGISGPYELRPAPGGGYAIAWMVPFELATLEPSGTPSYQQSAAVAAVDVDRDGRAELYYATKGTLVRLDGATRRETGRLVRPAPDRWRACEAADVDRDGAAELACLVTTESYFSGGPARLLILDAATLAVEFEGPSLALGGALAVGDVDGDPALELVTSGGYVYDGATHANQWAYGPGFGSFVAVGRPQAGGAPQIVGGAPLRGFSATLKSPLWEATSTTALPFLLRDVDGDGADEILAVSGFYPTLTAWRVVGGVTPLAEAFSATLGTGYLGGATAMAAGDLDGDGALELIFDDGGDSSGEDSLHVAGPLSAAAALRWSGVDPAQLDGPMIGGQLLRGPGGAQRVAFLSVRSDSSYAGARLALLDPATGGVETSLELGSNWGHSKGLAVADYDGDGVDEVFVGVDSYYDPFLAAWDPATDALAWQSQVLSTVGSSARVSAVSAADMTGDGWPDLVAITTSGTIWIEDVRNQALVWKSTALGYGDGGLAVADLDGDGRPEVVAAAGGRVVAYRWSAEAGVFLEVASVSLPSTGLAAGDCDGDGVPEVYVLATESSAPTATVTRLDAALQPLGSFAVASVVRAVFIEDLGSGRKNLVLSLSDANYLYSEGNTSLAAVDPASGAEVWRSPSLVGGAPGAGASWFRLGGAWRLAFGAGRSMYLTQ